MTGSVEINDVKTVIAMEIELVSSGTDRIEVKSVVEEQLHEAVRNAVIVANVIQAAVLALMTIVISNRHRKIWN